MHVEPSKGGRALAMVGLQVRPLQVGGVMRYLYLKKA